MTRTRRRGDRRPAATVALMLATRAAGAADSGTARAAVPPDLPCQHVMTPGAWALGSPVAAAPASHRTRV